ncbi:MAG: NADH-ubiquinone oxidoreductase-F iron-sulfur binding region domain-containing protein [Ancalomicrobiaceae bacterium]|nr:NADH-ubiquinone oxidoreductase-F iron-sulfur binding region domain-containing protein [Ancalomicrobiaceae bacterium]
MSIRLYIPLDTSARAVGADRVAKAVVAAAADRGVDIDLVRNGSRGLYWLEPLVEVETSAGRIAYGPVTPRDVAGLIDAGFLTGADHPLRIGNIESHPDFARETRLTFRRVGLIDPLSLPDFEAHRGLNGLRKALALAPIEIIDQVIRSGLRGRGGAGFPTGIKWKTVAETRAERKYVVCNVDEGDSGTFADRMVLEGDPFMLIEGMIIAGLAVGADKGYLYVRSEYIDAFRVLEKAIAIATDAGLLGRSVMGSGKTFELEARLGAGAYICGEEMSLIESLEGKRGVVRAKPPLPAHAGLFGMPTVVNNVQSLTAVPYILGEGPEAYEKFGQGRSRGTLIVQLTGNVKRGGLFELPFGISIREVVEGIGKGTRSGRPIRAVQVGGPLGAYFPESLFDTPLDYEAMAARGGMLGHGGIVVFDDTVDLASQARFAFAFCAHESCGKCTPCRLGAVRGRELMDRIIERGAGPVETEMLQDLTTVMTDASLCALGGLTPLPVMSAFKHFPEDFQRAKALRSAAE